MFKAVMFDLDGTLVDTLDDLMLAMNTMLSHFGYSERSRDEIISFIGNGQRAFVTESLPEYARDAENIDKCASFYSDFYSRNILHFSKPYTGICEILKELKANGIYIAIVSNKGDSHVRQIARGLFEENIFDIIIGVGSFKRKPDPEAPLYVAEKLGVRPSDCAFVGDSDVDIKTAKNAGMYALGVSWGFRDRKVLEDAGADGIADNAYELAEMLSVKLK